MTAPADSSPFTLFGRWLAEAEASEPTLPNAMALATADASGRPSVRQVLLKGWGEGGFDFYTNFGSRKAHELDANPQAALCFHWKSLARQVRIVGRVERVTDAESDRYFASRIRGSQLGAWASDQSATLTSRDQLERRVAEVTAEYDGADVPRPPFWGGYRVVPDEIEFWQELPARLHMRLLFERTEGWTRRELYP